MVLEDLMGAEEDYRHYRYMTGIGADTPPSDVYRVYLYNRTTGKWEESIDPKAFYDAKFNAFKGGTYSYAELYLNNTLTETVGQKPAVPGPTPPPQPAPSIKPTPQPSKKSGCFIATAAYGTPQAPQIDVLRQFRDERLMTDPFGRACVKGYYTLSPPIAEVVSMSETLRKAVRALIAPLVQGR